jgi:hypothetical protein
MPLQPDDILFIAIPLLIVSLLIGVAIWSVVMQRRGLVKTSHALDESREHTLEALEHSRLSLEISERGLAIAEQSLKLQEETVKLLREIAAKTSTR